ncbi:class I SAM-dependent methyltransferase [Lentisphaera profundi]|uniref:Class I SAM-dependent methyltransferase n=1 Tax=Lentisphaera profundi TaxID=1658616 RepID=A0ABY7VQY4_9BACT|nr:class I SAM-dependent methyltransferase [Lentisphaera profundi]WDE96124.1 class I SAM-dependent methyltransferase [Lentisphaera profundi]
MSEFNTIDWYDKNAENWSVLADGDDMSWPYSDFLSALPKTPAHILDLGCGNGRDILYFQKKGHFVDGIDGSKELCKYAEKSSNTQIYQQNFSQLKLKKNHYDGIFANAILMHIEPQDRINFLDQVFCGLCKNGVFYAHYPKGSESTLADDGRLLHLTPDWPLLAKTYNWNLELHEGRPQFLLPEDQNWEVIRFRKN